MYIYNSSETTKETVTLSAGTIKSGSGTIVDYNSGITRYNMANSTSQIETAYNKTHTEAGDIGGGIYMGHTPTSDSILLKSLEYTATGRPMLLMTCST